MVGPLLDRLQSLFKGLTYLAFPKVCWVCGQLLPLDSALICPGCVDEMLLDPKPACPRCGGTVGPHLVQEEGCKNCRQGPFPFERTFRLGPYEKKLREVILRMKKPGEESLAEAMALFWSEQMQARLSPLQPTVVLPVPLHWTRRLRRGFNQSEMLARHLARRLKVPCQSRWLRRIRRTHYQSSQPSPQARRDNVRGAFALRQGITLAGQVVVLVDDIYTTGATLIEAARILHSAKPARILAAVMGRVP